MSFLARGLSNLIGIIVPIVASFKILKKPTNKRLIQATQYWCVYGSFLIIDWFLTTFFVACFIPFYDFFVLSFTILMAVPQIGFATMVYTKFLAPFLRRYERRIDRFSAKITEKMWEKIPGIAATIPAVMASMVAVLNETPVPLSSLEIDETIPAADEPDASSIQVFRPENLQKLVLTARLNRSVEIQSEDDEQDISFQLDREIKQEILEEEDDVAEMVAPPRRRGMQTRRQARARSVM